MNLDLLDLILLCILAVGATTLFCVLAQMLDGNDPSEEEIEAALKRAEEEINNRPRVRAITKTN